MVNMVLTPGTCAVVSYKSRLKSESPLQEGSASAACGTQYSLILVCSSRDGMVLWDPVGYLLVREYYSAR